MCAFRVKWIFYCRGMVGFECVRNLQNLCFVAKASLLNIFACCCHESLRSLLKSQSGRLTCYASQHSQFKLYKPRGPQRGRLFSMLIRVATLRLLQINNLNILCVTALLVKNAKKEQLNIVKKCIVVIYCSSANKKGD